MKNIDNKTDNIQAVARDFYSLFEGGEALITGLTSRYHNNTISPEYNLPGC